jgi:hypothetical protein
LGHPPKKLDGYSTNTVFYKIKKNICVKTNAFVKVRHKCAQQDGKYGIKILFVGK